MNEILILMRKLNRFGVTHFVVSDEFRKGLRAHLREQQSHFLVDIPDPVHEPEEDAPLTFRGNRIFTQADLQHLHTREASEI